MQWGNIDTSLYHNKLNVTQTGFWTHSLGLRVQCKHPDRKSEKHESPDLQYSILWDYFQVVQATNFHHRRRSFNAQKTPLIIQKYTKRKTIYSMHLGGKTKFRKVLGKSNNRPIISFNWKNTCLQLFTRTRGRTLRSRADEWQRHARMPWCDFGKAR